MWNTGEGGFKVMKVKVNGVRFLANGVVCGLRRDNIRKGKNKKKEQNILYVHHYILALSTSAVVLDVDQSTMGKFMQEIVKDAARNQKKQ